MVIIPEPKICCKQAGKSLPFHGLRLEGAQQYGGSDLLKRKLWDLPRLSARDGFPIELEPCAEAPEGCKNEGLFRRQGYRLAVEKERVLICCDHRDGLANALSTLKQLLVQEEGGAYSLELCSITDWPLVEKRSISNCLTWYSGFGRIGFDMQLFGYEEWLEYLHICADLKINQFNMCIYGFWPFTMPGYPESEFRNVRVQLYNPETDSPIYTEFTHPNLAEEFLTRLIADAHALGVQMYAYMGLNSYSGGYPCVHKDKRMVLPKGSKYFNDFDRMCFSDEESMRYMKDCIRRVVRLGFDGIDFEESEEASWFCDCDACKEKFLADGNTPSDAMFSASFGLFREVYQVIRQENPDCAIGIRAFRQNPLIKSPEDMARIQSALPKDVSFFWAPGLYVPESEFVKWIDAFGPERIVGRDTESNGISACFGRLIRTFRTNGLRCASEPLQQYLEEDVRQHMGSARYGVAGTNGFMFEWYGFFLHLMVHANYPWGGAMEPEAFYRAATESLYHEDAETVLFAIQNMLTIHESQLNLFPQFLPFAAHKLEACDIPAIRAAMPVTDKIIADLSALLEKLEARHARKSSVAHIRKLLSANRRNRIIYDMALIDLALAACTAPEERRPLLLRLLELNRKDFDVVKRDFFDIYPMCTTGVKSCMIPCHELERVIQNELHPDLADSEMIYLGVEALGWMEF